MLAAPASLWVCPHDGAALRPAAHGFVCSGCQRTFPTLDGIACFTEEERLDPQQRIERVHRDQELDRPATPRLAYERRVELEAVMQRLPRRLMRPGGGLIVDAGCGIGRMTHHLLRRGSAVCALDFSLERLRYLQRRAPESGSLALATADVSHLPVAEATAAAIINTQVLEHLPPAAARQAVLDGFWRVLRPGGDLILTVYNFNLPWQRGGNTREGVHVSGVFYHCYEMAELRASLAAAGFEVIELCGIIHYLPHTYRAFPRLGGLSRWLDHRLEHHPGMGRRWGHLLLAHARRPD